jgi:NAD(P)-dependent dehydrogenase (short-subunit alcohol dehydrogenase family)
MSDRPGKTPSSIPPPDRPLAVITGPSRGIGRAITLAMARRGLSLALVGRPGDRLDAVAAQCLGLGVMANIYPCDLTDADAIARVANSLTTELGPPRCVINNAAELVRGPLVHETDVADWDRVLTVNLRAPFLLCRALLPAMLNVGRGRFVHVASISATIGSPNAAAYGASKWGLVGFSKSLAEELRGTGLTSVAVLPGSVDTDMLKKTPFEPQMSADQVADLVVYYALDAPDAVQGAAVEMFG